MFTPFIASCPTRPKRISSTLQAGALASCHSSHSVASRLSLSGIVPSYIVTAASWVVEEKVQETQQSQPSPTCTPHNWLFVPESVLAEVLQWGHSSQLSCHPGHPRPVLCPAIIMVAFYVPGHYVLYRCLSGICLGAGQSAFSSVNQTQELGVHPDRQKTEFSSNTLRPVLCPFKFHPLLQLCYPQCETGWPFSSVPEGREARRRVLNSFFLFPTWSPFFLGRSR